MTICTYTIYISPIFSLCQQETETMQKPIMQKPLKLTQVSSLRFLPVEDSKAYETKKYLLCGWRLKVEI